MIVAPSPICTNLLPFWFVFFLLVETLKGSLALVEMAQCSHSGAHQIQVPSSATLRSSSHCVQQCKTKICDKQGSLRTNRYGLYGVLQVGSSQFYGLRAEVSLETTVSYRLKGGVIRLSLRAEGVAQQPRLQKRGERP